MTSANPQLAADLTALTGRQVMELAPLTGGACQESFVVELDSGDGSTDRYVLRSDAPTHLPGSIARRDEYPVIQAAIAAGVRTPAVSHLVEDLLRPGASAYLMEFVPGTALGRKVVSAADFESARPGLVEALCAELVKIHSITPASGLELAEPERTSALATGSIDAALSLHRRALDLLDSPMLELTYRWLDDHRPTSSSLVLCHGDFRTGNYTVLPDRGLVAILDWEFAHWSDPMDDLGWLCVRDWRFGEIDKPAFGLTSRDELFAAYAAAGGAAIDREAVHYWEIMGNLRWAIGALFQGRRFESADHSGGADLELYAIGRRAIEIEYETLRLIERGPL